MTDCQTIDINVVIISSSLGISIAPTTYKIHAHNNILCSSWTLSLISIRRIHAHLIIQTTTEIVLCVVDDSGGTCDTTIDNQWLGLSGVISRGMHGNSVPIVEKLQERTGTAFALLKCSGTHYTRHCEPFSGQNSLDCRILTTSSTFFWGWCPGGWVSRA